MDSVVKPHNMDSVVKPTLLNSDSNLWKKETVINQNFLSVQVWLIFKYLQYSHISFVLETVKKSGIPPPSPFFYWNLLLFKSSIVLEKDKSNPVLWQLLRRFYLMRSSKVSISWFQFFLAETNHTWFYLKLLCSFGCNLISNFLVVFDVILHFISFGPRETK